MSRHRESLAPDQDSSPFDPGLAGASDLDHGTIEA
jgi:hypothetical protein